MPTTKASGLVTGFAERDDDVARLQARLGGRTVRGDRVPAVRQAVADLDALTFVLLVEVDPDDRVHGLPLVINCSTVFLTCAEGWRSRPRSQPGWWTRFPVRWRSPSSRRMTSPAMLSRGHRSCRVDRRIGLDGIDEGGVRGAAGRDRSVQGALTMPAGHGGLQPERSTDGDDLVTDDNLGGVADRQRVRSVRSTLMTARS